MVTMIVPPPGLSTRGTRDHVAAIQGRFKGGRANFGGCVRVEQFSVRRVWSYHHLISWAGRTDPRRELELGNPNSTQRSAMVRIVLLILAKADGVR